MVVKLLLTRRPGWLCEAKVKSFSIFALTIFPQSISALAGLIFFSSFQKDYKADNGNKDGQNY